MTRLPRVRLPGASHPFVRDTLTLQTGQVALAVVHALRAFVVLAWLGPVAYGPLALAQSLVALVSFADASTLGRAALVEVTRAMQRPASPAKAPALARFLALHLGINSVVVAAGWGLGPMVGALAYGRDDVGVFARWLALPLLAEAPFLFVSLVLQASRQMRALVVIETARAVVLLVVTVVALRLSPSAWSVIAAHLATAGVVAASACAGYGALRRGDPALPSWRALARLIPRVHFGQTARSSALIAGDKYAGNLAAQLPVLLLGLSDTTAVAHLVAAIRVMAIPAPLLTGLSRTLDVELAARAVNGRAAVRRFLIGATWRASLAWWPVAAAAAIVATFGLVPVLGEAYAPARAAIGPLFVHSAALGLGVGLGPAFRALDAVGLSLASTVATVLVTIGPGAWLTAQFGVAGGAAFHAFRGVVGLAIGATLVARALARGEARGTRDAGATDLDT